jgi:cytochrome b
MIFGIIAMFLLVVRIVMGVVGSRYSRFSSYPVRPGEVVSYMISAAVSKTKLYAGNNPGSATAAVLMFLLVPALFLSGVGYGGEAIEELHEAFAWALLVVILMHLAGPRLAHVPASGKYLARHGHWQESGQAGGRHCIRPIRYGE